MSHQSAVASVVHAGNEIGEANARLIAAAPDLLAACLRALEYAPNEIEANVLRRVIAKAQTGGAT